MFTKRLPVFVSKRPARRHLGIFLSLLATTFCLSLLFLSHSTAAAAGLVSPVRQANCTSISYAAAPTSGSIGQPAETDCFTFSGTAGERVRRWVVRTSGTLLPYHEVLRPDGTTLCGPTTSREQTCMLDTDGTHTVLVRDSSGTGTGSYRLSLLLHHVYLPLVLR
jgi:hypothetical protein